MAAIAVIQASFQYKTQDEFIKAMTPFISERGFFIHTKTTKPVGAEVQFEFWIDDDSVCYSGIGVVREEIPCRSSFDMRKSGMLVSLKKVNQAFSDVLDAVLVPEMVGESRTSREDNRANMGPQKIVESRGGDLGDVFGDFDFDAGLDSIFSSIEKSPSQEMPQVNSGLLARPIVDVVLEVNPDIERIDFAYIVLDHAIESYVDTPTPRPTVYVPTQMNEDVNEKSTGQFTAPSPELLKAWENGDVSMNDVREALEAPATGVVEEYSDSTIEMSPTASMFRSGSFSQDVEKTQDIEAVSLEGKERVVSPRENFENEAIFGDKLAEDVENRDAFERPQEAYEVGEGDLGENLETETASISEHAKESVSEDAGVEWGFRAENAPEENLGSDALLRDIVETTSADESAAKEDVESDELLRELVLGNAQPEEPPSAHAFAGMPDAAEKQEKSVSIVPPVPVALSDSIESMPRAVASGGEREVSTVERPPVERDLYLSSDAHEKKARHESQPSNLMDQSPEDIIMQSVATPKSSARKRRSAASVVESEVPAEPVKKGGFFSHLFKK